MKTRRQTLGDLVLVRWPSNVPDGSCWFRVIPAPADPPLVMHWPAAQITGHYEIPEYNIRRA